MTDLSWVTLESSVAYSCGGFDVVNDTVQLPDGETSEFDYLSSSESVVILPFTPEGDVVLIEEWRHAVGRRNRALPAGNLEPGEMPETAVHRELREETGHETDDIEHLSTVEPANGFSDAVFHYYVARDCEATATQDLDENESIEVTQASFASLLDDLEAGDLRDGRSAHGIAHYALFERD
jgi:ADP-ribose pyrophosphatase